MWFLSYFLTLTPSLNGFAELPATLVSELGCQVRITFKRVGLAAILEHTIYLYRVRFGVEKTRLFLCDSCLYFFQFI